MDYWYIGIFNYSQRSPAPPQTCARSGRTTVLGPCPACTSWARHAPLMHARPAPSSPGAFGYMNASRQHHAAAKQVARGRPLGAAQPGGTRDACKAPHCVRSWQGLPRLTPPASMACIPDMVHVGGGSGGGGQPREPPTGAPMRSAHRPCTAAQGARTHSASSVGARAWDWLKGAAPASKHNLGEADHAGMHKGAGRTGRVRKHAASELLVGGLDGVCKAPAVGYGPLPCLAGPSAPPARPAVVSPGRWHAATALGPPGINTAGPHGGRASGHPARRRARRRAQRRRGRCTNVQACLVHTYVLAGVLGAPWSATGRVHGAWVGMPTCLPGRHFVRIRATPTSRSLICGPLGPSIC